MKAIFKTIMFIHLCVLVGCTEVEDIDTYNVEAPVTPSAKSTSSSNIYFSETIPNHNSSESFKLLIGKKPDLSDAKIWGYENQYGSSYITGLESSTTYYYQLVKYNEFGTELKGSIESATTLIEVAPANTSTYHCQGKDMSVTSSFKINQSVVEIKECGFEISQDNATTKRVKSTGNYSIVEGKTYNISISIDDNVLGDFKKGLVTYVKPYVITNEYTTYGTNTSFFPVSEEKNGIYYVDLGLPSGTLWGAHNNSADAPYLSGLYYEEGKWSKDTQNYRMPTYDDAKELYDNCTWEKTTLVNTCAKIIGPNGNVIYFPFSGYYSISFGKYYGKDEDSSIWLNSKYDGFWRILDLTEKIGYTYYSYHGYKRNIRFVKDNK